MSRSAPESKVERRSAAVTRFDDADGRRHVERAVSESGACQDGARLQKAPSTTCRLKLMYIGHTPLHALAKFVEGRTRRDAVLVTSKAGSGSRGTRQQGCCCGATW